MEELLFIIKNIIRKIKKLLLNHDELSLLQKNRKLKKKIDILRAVSKKNSASADMDMINIMRVVNKKDNTELIQHLIQKNNNLINETNNNFAITNIINSNARPNMLLNVSKPNAIKFNIV